MKNIIFIAPPASGKGTQSKLISNTYNIPHISMGEIMRDSRNPNTDIGKIIIKCQDERKLVPLDITLKLIKERLRNECAEALITTAEEAAKLIKDGMVVGVSGFTPSGYPKAVPVALAERANNGDKFQIDLYSGASLGPEIDTMMVEAGIPETTITGTPAVSSFIARDSARREGLFPQTSDIVIVIIRCMASTGRLRLSMMTRE